MDSETLIWISQTLLYAALFFVLFLISKFMFQLRFRKIDIELELTGKDNTAFAVLNIGFYVAILIIYLGVLQGESLGFYWEVALILGYGLIGNLLLLLGSMFNEKVLFAPSFSLTREIIRDRNMGTAFAEAGSFIGAALIIYGAISGNHPNLFPEMDIAGYLASGLVILLGLWLAGQIVLFAMMKAYTAVTQYRVMEELKKDNAAVGLVYGSVIVAVGYLFGHAIEGDITNWNDKLENFVYYFGFAIVFLPLARLFVDRVILPGRSLKDEIVNQDVPNIGAAIIEAFAYVGSAVLISYCI